MHATGLPVEQLRLIGITVGVLGEQHPAGFDQHHRVAHIPIMQDARAAAAAATTTTHLGPLGWANSQSFADH